MIKIHCSSYKNEFWNICVCYHFQCKFEWSSPAVALVAFCFPVLIPPSDSGSTPRRPRGADGKHLSSEQRMHAGKLCQLPSCVYSMKTQQMRLISVTLTCPFESHKKATGCVLSPAAIIQLIFLLTWWLFWINCLWTVRTCGLDEVIYKYYCFLVINLFRQFCHLKKGHLKMPPLAVRAWDRHFSVFYDIL